MSLPVQIAMCQHAPLGVFGALGVTVWCVGFFLEAVGDAQLAKFKADPTSTGRMMDRGLLNVTGKPLLEKGMRRSRGEAYEQYAARTSGFFPRPPRR